MMEDWPLMEQLLKCPAYDESEFCRNNGEIVRHYWDVWAEFSHAEVVESKSRARRRLCSSDTSAVGVDDFVNLKENLDRCYSCDTVPDLHAQRYDFHEDANTHVISIYCDVSNIDKSRINRDILYSPGQQGAL